MRSARAIASILAALALFSACETTGDPRQGGLFGWSEVKARERQAERQTAVAAAEARLVDEQQRGAQLQTREIATDRRLAAATTSRDRTAAQLRIRETSVRAKASLLEQESPTAASASRARRLRAGVDAVLADRSLSAEERARQIHDLEAEIDAARAGLAR